MKRPLAVLLVCGCAGGGPHDALDGSGKVVSDGGASPHSGYAYVARRPLVAVGLASESGMSDDETHRVVDRLADQASACFRKSNNLTAGAAHIELPIDDGGGTGAPVTVFSPPTSAALGMVCILAPMRLTAFAPGAAGRSITVEAAWGNDLAP